LPWPLRKKLQRRVESHRRRRNSEAAFQVTILSKKVITSGAEPQLRMSSDIDNLTKELGGLTERLTTQVRTLTLGLLAFTAGILGGVFGLGSRETPLVLPRWVQLNLLVVAVCLFLVLLGDLLQCVLSIRATEKTIDDAEEKIEQKEITEDATILYDYELWEYRWSTHLYWGKVWLLSLTTVWFAIVTAVYCLRHLK
jgi:hypothetical protein